MEGNGIYLFIFQLNKTTQSREKILVGSSLKIEIAFSSSFTRTRLIYYLVAFTVTLTEIEFYLFKEKKNKIWIHRFSKAVFIFC